MSRLLNIAVLTCVATCALSVSGRTVRVSEFGFDENDSTRFLQAAIDSGAEKVVIDARHWITEPLRGRSNQELFFEDGAIVEAKKGAYRDKNDCVFSFPACSNVVIGGKGTIRMHHADYMKPPYAKAEWRHAINIIGSSGVRVWGLRLLNTGGDGVYVGGLYRLSARKYKLAGAVPNCRDIRLEDLYIDTNVRQGLSVTAVDGFVAERCVFKNTKGLPPQAGVDFEPNKPDNLMRGIVMRDCVFENNKGHGIELALGHNEAGKSVPFDMTFERCRTIGNATGVTVHNTRPDNTEVGGKLVFKDCSFEHPRYTALAINLSSKRPFDCRFFNCRVVERNAEGVEGATAIDDEWLADNISFLASDSLVPKSKPRPDFSRANVYDSCVGEMVKLSNIRFRNHSRFVFYADSKRKVNFVWKQNPIGKYAKLISGEVQLTDVDGKVIASNPLPGKAKETLTFDAPCSGFYFLDAKHSRLQLTLLESDAPIAADLSDDWRNAICSTGELYFYVREKSPKFGFFAAGDGGEAIGMEILSPSGRSVFKRPSVYSWQGHVEQADAESGLWTVRFSKPEKGSFEDWRFDITGIEGHVFLSPKKYWSFK